MSPAPSDEQLVEDFQNHLDRANQVFWQIHARYSIPLLAYLSNRGPQLSAAEDILHATWLRVWLALSQGACARPFRKWLLEQARDCLSEQTTDEGDREAEQKKTLRICLEELTQTQPQAAAVLRARLQGRNRTSTGEDLRTTPEEGQRLFDEACRHLQELQRAAGTTPSVCLEMPETPEELAPWLEGHLLGPHLLSLVLELEVFRDAPPAPGARLETVLEDWLEPILRQGLRQVPPPLVGELLRQPRLLLELQKRIVTLGGPCWLRQAEASAELQPLRQRSQERLIPDVAQQWQPAANRSPGVDSAPDQPTTRPRLRWLVLPWLITTLAVAVLLGVLFSPPVPEGNPDSWGWNRPAALDEGVLAAAYLNQLADAAEEWFRHRPENPVALARRVQDFRLGCTRLLLASHTPLTEEESFWLRERCRACAANLNQALVLIEAGKTQQGRDTADATIRQVVQVLRRKAKEM